MRRMLCCVEYKAACRPPQTEGSLASFLIPWQCPVFWLKGDRDTPAPVPSPSLSLPMGSSGHTTGCWRMSFTFQKNAQNKVYFGHGHVILMFVRNCVLNLKSLLDKNGTCGKKFCFWRIGIFLIEFISPDTSGNYNVHLVAGLMKSTGA